MNSKKNSSISLVNVMILVRLQYHNAIGSHNEYIIQGLSNGESKSVLTCIVLRRLYGKELRQ